MTPRSLERATVQAKLRLMQELLDDLALVGAVTPARLKDDRLALRAVERVLTQLVDLAASVNAHIVTAAAGSAPNSYRSSFDDLAKLDVIPQPLAEHLKPSVGLRNLLVHEYAAVDLDRVVAAVPIAEEQYAEYVRCVAGWLTAQPDD